MGQNWSSGEFENLDRELLEARPGAKWQLNGPGILSMWVADMDFPVAPMVRGAIEDQLATGDMGYPMRSLGHDVSKEFAGRMQERYSWTIDPHDVRVTTDVIQSMQAMLLTCTKPGDGVTMQTPIYHPFLNTITEMKRPLIDNPWLRSDGEWVLDIDGLRRTLSETPAKVLILCNPHNPTGRVFTREELEALAEVVLDHELLVISDEIHAEILHPGQVHIPFASLSEQIADRTMTLNAASKAFNLAGLKLSVAHTTSEFIAERFDGLPSHLFGGNNTFGLRATLACWRDGQEWFDAMLGRLTSNRDLLADLIREHIPEISYEKPEATYLAWLDCSRLDLGGAEPADYFLERAKVAFSPGVQFGPKGAGHCRMNFATGPEVITEAVERMAASLR